MPTIEVSQSVNVAKTPRVQQLCGIFDVPPCERSEQTWSCTLPLDDRDWQIGLIHGASGSGKSTLARKLWPELIDRTFSWPKDKSIVDAFPKGMKIKEIAGLLSSVGFSSPPSWLRPFRCLSNGEQFRVTLARTLAEHPDFAVVDEFTSVVDRQVAQIGSAAIAKTVRRRGGKFVAVSCHSDIIDWLEPDWTYQPQTDEFHWRCERPGQPPQWNRPAISLKVERVHRRAWQLFHHHHYLSSALNRTAACFVATVDGSPAAFTAVLAFPHPTMATDVGTSEPCAGERVVAECFQFATGDEFAHCQDDTPRIVGPLSTGQIAGPLACVNGQRSPVTGRPRPILNPLRAGSDERGPGLADRQRFHFFAPCASWLTASRSSSETFG